MIPKSPNSNNSSTLSYKTGAIVVYQKDSTPVLGLILKESSKKHRVLNSNGAELDIADKRLFLIPGSAPSESQSQQSKIDWLKGVIEESKTHEINLKEIWELTVEETKEYTADQIAEIYFNKATTANTFSTLNTLFNDRVFFKCKNLNFTPRSASSVEELQNMIKAEA